MILDDEVPPGRPFLDESSETDGDGVLRRRWLRDGLHLRFDRAGCVPSWTRLSGMPPYEVRLGSAVIEVDVTGLESAACVRMASRMDPRRGRSFSGDSPRGRTR